MDLTKIKGPSFLKELTEKELNDLAKDIRQFIIESVSQTGGHLSSNLGIVELTIALHYVFNSPEDKIFFDVGHQCYVHKILTGRAKDFTHLRKFNGLSGFQKRCESKHDVWEAGHSSTALSAAVAMAIARDLNKESFSVVPVVGDGAIVGGESLEALNHLGSINNKVILILNDNQMSISKSIGGMNNFLNNVRMSNTYNKMKDDYRSILQHGKLGEGVYKATKYIKDFVKRGFINDTIFEDFGIDYLGPVDGHNIVELIRVLQLAQKNKKSVVVHVVTEKGKGYSFAENDQEGKWHGTPPFNVKSGRVLSSGNPSKKSWSEIISDQVLQWMKIDKDIVSITPAMIKGSAMNNLFKVFQERCFDVGIAEQHAVTMAAGMAKEGMIPFVPIYSSFYQRAYDQVIHDVAMQNLPVIMCVDRAGIVGADGETHQGTLDMAFFRLVPNLTIIAPKDFKEFEDMLEFAVGLNKPVVIRYPRGGEDTEVKFKSHAKIELGKAEVLHEVKKLENPTKEVTIIAIGKTVSEAVKLADRMQKEEGITPEIINARFLKPFDSEKMIQSIQRTKNVITIEDGTVINGLATTVKELIVDNNIQNVKFKSYAYPDKFIMHT